MSIYLSLLRRPKRCSICKSLLQPTASVGQYVNGKYIVHVYWCGDYDCAREYARSLVAKALSGGVQPRPGYALPSSAAFLSAALEHELSAALEHEAARRAAGKKV